MTGHIKNESHLLDVGQTNEPLHRYSAAEFLINYSFRPYIVISLMFELSVVVLFYNWFVRLQLQPLRSPSSNLFYASINYNLYHPYHAR